MYMLRGIFFTIVVLISVTSSQDLDISNDDSTVLLTLTQSQPDKFDTSTSSPLLTPTETESGKSPNTDSDNLVVVANEDEFFKPSKPSAPSSPSARLSLFQSFLAGRSTTAAARPNPIVDTIQNLNINGRLAKLRERIGRFRVPRLMTNEKSFSYRAGRRVGLFIQAIGNRARALAARLRARAATPTPTAT